MNGRENEIVIHIEQTRKANRTVGFQIKAAMNMLKIRSKFNRCDRDSTFSDARLESLR